MNFRHIRNKTITLTILVISFLWYNLIVTSSIAADDLQNCESLDIYNNKVCMDTMTYSDGTKYTGEFRYGVMNGQGTLIYPDGTNYTGQWKDALPNGQGTRTYAGGKTYTGQWKDALPNGQR